MNKTRPKQNAAEHRAVLISKVAAAEETTARAVNELYLANARAAAAEQLTEAYRNAKEQNDERFMTERDQARFERDAALQLLRDYDSIKTAAQHKDWTARWREMTGTESVPVRR